MVRRMFRLLHNAGTVLSLLLCVVTCMLWVRSYRRDGAERFGVLRDLSIRDDETGLSGSDGAVDHYSIDGYKGTVAITCIIFNPGALPPGYRVTNHPSPPHWSTEHYDIFGIDPPDVYAGSGWHQLSTHLFWRAEDIMPPRYHVFIVCRFWTVLIFLSIMPASWCYRRWYSCDKIPKDHCAICGYDVRATPDRCPECGAVPRPGKPIGTTGEETGASQV
jgi:hypothetical protein